MPMSLVGELVSIGTLLAFVLVCIGVPILRVANPNIERPFKVPGGMIGAWVVGIAGALACLYVMWGLPKDTWLRLIIWLEIGLAIYGVFGWRHSRLADPTTHAGARLVPQGRSWRWRSLAFIPTMWFAIKVFGTGQ